MLRCRSQVLIAIIKFTIGYITKCLLTLITFNFIRLLFTIWPDNSVSVHVIVLDWVLEKTVVISVRSFLIPFVNWKSNSIHLRNWNCYAWLNVIYIEHFLSQLKKYLSTSSMISEGFSDSDCFVIKLFHTKDLHVWENFSWICFVLICLVSIQFWSMCNLHIIWPIAFLGIYLYTFFRFMKTLYVFKPFYFLFSIIFLWENKLWRERRFFIPEITNLKQTCLNIYSTKLGFFLSGVQEFSRHCTQMHKNPSFVFQSCRRIVLFTSCKVKQYSFLRTNLNTEKKRKVSRCRQEKCSYSRMQVGVLF